MVMHPVSLPISCAKATQRGKAATKEWRSAAPFGKRVGVYEKPNAPFQSRRS
jgi:hypothetical protein